MTVQSAGQRVREALDRLRGRPVGRATRSYLVPAYFFQIDGTWTRQVGIIAVQDRFLTAPRFTAVPLRRAGG